MLRIESIKLSNWCQHATGEYQFTPGTNGIVGPNGIGKSNLVGALRAAMTGQMTVGTIEENIRDGANGAEILTVFNLDGLEGVIERKFDAPYDDTGERTKVKSSATLKFGDLKVRGSRKVTKELEKLTGWQGRSAVDQVFVSQTQLTALLFQEPAERMSNFVSLIPEVSKAEPLRTALQAELNRFPLIELATSPESMKQQLDALTTAVTGLATQDKECVATMASLESVDFNGVITRFTEHKQLMSQKVTIAQEQATSELQIDELTVKSANLDTELAPKLTELATLESQVDGARASLSSAERDRAMYTQRKAAETRDAEAHTALAALTKPAASEEWVALPELAKQRDIASATVVQLRQTIELLSSGVTACPTCSKAFDNPADELAQAQAKLQEYSTPLTVLDQELARLRKEQQDYAVTKARYDSEITRIEGILSETLQTLNGLPKVELPDAQAESVLKQVVQQHAALKANVAQLQASSAQWAAQASAKQARLVELSTARTDIDAKLLAAPTEEDYRRAIEAQQSYRSQQSLLAETRGTLNAKTDELKRQTHNYEQAMETVKRIDAVQTYRGVIEGCREVLHRDNLPSIVLSQRIQEFNQATNRFLKMFGSPFAVEIDRNMTIDCIFSDGYTRKSERLSGGQRAALSVSARFALHEIFASQVGFLVMDEPSQNMDGDNVQWLGLLMEQVSRVSREACAQTIIVTHHFTELRGCFENVINLTPVAQVQQG